MANGGSWSNNNPINVKKTMTDNAPPRAPPPKMLPLLAAVLLLLAWTKTTTTEAFAFSPTATTPPSSSRSRAAASSASSSAIVTRSAATNDDAGDGGASASSASAKEVEANASRARETPTLTDEDRSFVSSLCAQFGDDDAGDVDEDVSTEMMDEISWRLDAMPPRLLVALQMAGESLEWKEEQDGGGGGGTTGGGFGGMTGDDFEAQMVRVGRSLRRVLDGRLDSGRRLLEELLKSGEIRKLDALIGRSAREGKLDTSFFQVLSVNMRDAARNGDDDGGGGVGATPTTIAGPPGAGADRRQILQHVYTRCQEELEKNVPPGIGLLNKLLRTEVPSIRDNQLRHYLGPQAASITSPDGKVIELPNVDSKPLVSHVEFADAISDAVSRIRGIERAGGTDKLSASSLVEGVRRIAAEARSVLASVHGEDGDVVVEFQGGLQIVFRPGSSAPAPPAAAAASSADPTATSATAM